MLIYKTGDLMQADEPIIVHGCNAQGVMGSGVALAIRNAYPEAYTGYRAEYDRAGLRVGQIVWIETRGKLIGNAISQEWFGRDGKQYVSYGGIEAIFQQIYDIITSRIDPEYHDVPVVAIPRIGSALGGGDWRVISQIINVAMKDRDVVVYDLPLTTQV
jgi:O-acetyl-ADP-ribose deacetylase (regulator of RNase III)